MFRFLFGFHGRMRRLSWWLTRLGIYAGAILAMLVVFGVTMSIPNVDVRSAVEGVFMLLIVVPMVWVEVATSVRRLHDIDMSGWFYLISMIPLVGLVFYVVVLGFIPGTKGANQYGPSPALSEPDHAADVFA